MICCRHEVHSSDEDEEGFDEACDAFAEEGSDDDGTARAAGAQHRASTARVLRADKGPVEAGFPACWQSLENGHKFEEEKAESGGVLSVA